MSRGNHRSIVSVISWPALLLCLGCTASQAAERSQPADRTTTLTVGQSTLTVPVYGPHDRPLALTGQTPPRSDFWQRRSFYRLTVGQASMDLPAER